MSTDYHIIAASQPIESGIKTGWQAHTARVNMPGVTMTDLTGGQSLGETLANASRMQRDRQKWHYVERMDMAGNVYRIASQAPGRKWAAVRDAVHGTIDGMLDNLAIIQAS